MSQFKKGSTPWNKGKVASWAIGNKHAIGNTPWNKGGTHTKEARQKISAANKGQRRSPKTEFSSERTSGENNVNWKPDDQLKNASIHWWVRTHLKKTGVCEHCKESKKTEWSDKQHAYNSRKREAWQELCRRCHMSYDNLVLGIRRGRRTIVGV